MTPNADYNVMSFIILSNRADWRVVRTLGLPVVTAQETVATGTSDEVWAGVAFDPEAEKVIIASVDGTIYSLENQALEFQGETNMTIFDVSFSFGTLWVAHLSNDAVLVTSVSTDTFRGEITHAGTGAIPSETVSMSWDRFGYFIFTHSAAGLVRYDPLNGESVVVCEDFSFNSHGMFMDYATSTVLLRDHIGANLPMSFGTANHCFSKKNAMIASLINSTESFVSYKFDSVELMREAIIAFFFEKQWLAVPKDMGR